MPSGARGLGTAGLGASYVPSVPTEGPVQRFERDGYVVVPGAIPRTLTDPLIGGARGRRARREPARVHAPQRPAGHRRARHLHRGRVRPGRSLLRDLVDLPAVIGPIVQLLGWNIYVHGAVAIVRRLRMRRGRGRGRAVHQLRMAPRRRPHEPGGHGEVGPAASAGREGRLLPLRRVRARRANLRVIPGSHAWAASPSGKRHDSGVAVCAPARSVVCSIAGFGTPPPRTTQT